MGDTMQSPMLRRVAIFVFLVSSLLYIAPTVLADEANPIEVRAIVKAGDACPSTPATTSVPQFRAGDTVSLCLAQPLPSANGTTNITVGQLPGIVGTSTQDSVLLSLPEEPRAGSYAVAGTINGAAIMLSSSAYCGSR